MMEERRYDEMDGGTILNFLAVVYNNEICEYTDSSDNNGGNNND